MQGESAKAEDHLTAQMVMRPAVGETMDVIGWFDFECYDADGNLKWRDRAWNVVTTEGKNAMLDKFLGLGAAYAAIALGLHTTVGNASSTYATPSPQVESTVYSNANRPTPSFSAASGGVKSTSSAASFNINGSATITGAFLAIGAAGVTTKGDTAAASSVLYSSGTFSAGSRAVVSGDTLNVSYSSTLT